MLDSARAGSARRRDFGGVSKNLDDTIDHDGYDGDGENNCHSAEEEDR